MGRNKKKIAGIILFWVGIAGIISCLLLLANAFAASSETEVMGSVILSWYILWPTIFILIIGITLYFVGRSQEKKRRSLPEAHDSNSDYHKTVKKLRL
jgi:uncharacterized membrane protein